jgi:glycosyltransferase involved in cell wall biosynthesis
LNLINGAYLVVKKDRISIVLPNLHEEAIFGLIKELRKLFKGEDLEIIVVNRSSPEYYKKLKATGVKIIEQKRLGVEYALMDGLKHATGDILASTDADATHESIGLVKGVKLVRNNKSDFVLGNRLAGLTKGSMPPHIKFGNSSLSKIYSTTFNQNIHDVLSGLFVMSREAYEAIKNVEPYKAGIAFLAIELSRRGFRVTEVPIKYYPRKYGKSQLAKSKIYFGVGVALHTIRGKSKPKEK